MKSVVVLGGGLTGLSCAYFASRAGLNVTILEALPKLGGLLDTFEIGGTRLERFYHHFFTHDTELLWLLNELGISNQLIFYDSTMGIFSKDRIYNFNGPLDLLNISILSFVDKVRFGLTSIYLSKFADWRKYEQIPIYDWFLTYAGKNVTKVIWEPLLRSKFGTYYDRIPLSWMIGRLSQRVGSRKDVKEELGYLTGSTDVLLSSLVTKLKSQHVNFITDCRVENILGTENRLTKLITNKGEFSADSYISTIPATHISKLLEKTNPDYANRLSKIEYFGAMCLVYELTKPLGKVYWLNVAEKNFSFGGVIEHTKLVPPRMYGGSHVVYLSRYFSRQEKIGSLSDDEIDELMFHDLQKIYPKLTRSTIKNTYLFRTDVAATVCDLNFSQKVPTCQTPIENLYLVNMAHIYPDERSCNNSIRTAGKACRAMGIDTSYVPNGRSLSGLIGMG